MSEAHLDFGSLVPIEVSVTLPGGKRCVLCEASGEAAGRYQSEGLKGADIILNDDGTRTIRRMEGVASSASLLISLCLYEITDSGGKEIRKQVPIQEVRKLPERVQKKLLQKVKEISDMDDENLEALEKQIVSLQSKVDKMKKEEGKNELSGMTGGSV